MLVACLNLNKVIRCSLNHIWILMSTYNFHYQENCKFKSLFCFSVFMYSGALVMQTRLLFLHRIFISKKSQNSPVSSTWSQLDETIDYSQVYIAPLDHLMQILPRQPNMVDFVVCRVCYGWSKSWKSVVLLLCWVSNEFIDHFSGSIVKWR